MHWRVTPMVALTALLLTACGGTPATNTPGPKPTTAAELPKCVITWAEARLGDAQPGGDFATWQSAQKHSERAAAAIVNRFTTPAVKGDSVYVVSEDGHTIQAVGIDDTMPVLATKRGLRVGDLSQRVLDLYGHAPGGSFQSFDYTDLTSGQPTLKLHVQFKTAWNGDLRVTAIEWTALTPQPDKPVCQ